MKLNKTKIMETPLGFILRDCLLAWDDALDAMEIRDVESDEFRVACEVSRDCMEKWGVYRAVIEYLAGTEVYVKRREDCIGVATVDEDEWLLKILR